MPGPTISISPAPGALTRSQTITVEITDTVPIVLEYVRLTVDQFAIDTAILFQSGGGGPATVQSSSFYVVTTAITDDFRYEIVHAGGGWLGPFSIKVDARNATDGSSATAAYTAAEPYVPLALVPFANPPAGPIAADQSIEIDLEYDGSISSYAIYVIYADEFMQLVAADLAAIAVFGVVPFPPYSGVESNPTSDVLRFVLTNQNGWRAGLFQIYVAATSGGNQLFIGPEAVFSGDAFTSTAQPPGVSIVSPPVGQPIAATTPLVFDVVDDSGAFRRVIVAVYNPVTGQTVIVHDGDSFLGGFALQSQRSMIPGGFQFAVVPDSGWTASPTLRVFAIDRSGEEV